jgi:hypothetical protein
MPDVHVMYNGTHDINFDELFTAERKESIGLAADAAVTSKDLSNNQIKAALVQHFDVGPDEFNDHYVDIAPNGNITVRPSTPFGI